MILMYTILIAILSYGGAYAQSKCCNGTQNILAKGKCKDNTSFTGISCPRRYLLESEVTENFTIDSYGNLMENQVLISPDKYCLSKLEENGPDVALVCFSESSEHVGLLPIMFTIRAICGLLSVISLVLTITVYILVPELRDLNGKCLLSVICPLALAMFLLGILQLRVSLSETMCITSGYTVMWTFLNSFAWVNALSFQIWRITAYPNMLGTASQWYKIYCIYGYGIPTTIVLAAIIAHHMPGDHIKPRIGESSCWFTSRDGTWAYFYGPIGVFLVLNVIFFILTSKAISKNMRDCNNSARFKSLKYKLTLHVTLFFIMGLSWIFELLSFAFQYMNEYLDYFWLLTDFINGLQGVLIFWVFVLRRKRVQRGLARRGISCIPQKWKALKDEECEETQEEEKLANIAVSEQTLNVKENQSIV